MGWDFKRTFSCIRGQINHWGGTLRSSHYSKVLCIVSLTIWNFHNAISICCLTYILPTNVKLAVWTLQNINIFAWRKITSIVKRYSVLYPQIVSDTKYNYLVYLFYFEKQRWLNGTLLCRLICVIRLPSPTSCLFMQLTSGLNQNSKHKIPYINLICSPREPNLYNEQITPFLFL